MPRQSSVGGEWEVALLSQHVPAEITEPRNESSTISSRAVQSNSASATIATGLTVGCSLSRPPSSPCFEPVLTHAVASQEIETLTPLPCDHPDGGLAVADSFLPTSVARVRVKERAMDENMSHHVVGVAGGDVRKHTSLRWIRVTIGCLIRLERSKGELSPAYHLYSHWLP